jgi:hypothetical protein
MRPLFEFRLPPESCPTLPSQSASANRQLSWAFAPFSTLRLGSPLFAGLPAPATFRPQGLVTLAAAYSFRAPAGYFSRRRRSWDSPFGASSSRNVSAAFPRGRAHVPFFPSVFPSAEANGPAQRAAASGLRPFRESLAAGRGLARRLLAAPLGFTLLGPSGWLPCPGFRPGSSLTLCRPAPEGPNPPASQSLDRRPLGPVRLDRQAGRRGRDNPSRVPAPVRSRILERAHARAMCSPHAAPHITAGLQHSWGVLPRSTGVTRASPEVPNFYGFLRVPGNRIR